MKDVGFMRRILNILFCIALMCVSCIKDGQPGRDLAVNDRVPDFMVTMNDGITVTGERLCNGVSCIVFFTTVCPDCRQTLPEVQKIYDDYLSLGVSFALISRQEGEDSIAKFWREQGMSMPYSAQNDRKVYELFATTRVPRVYICRDGIIKSIFTDSPTPSYEDMKAALDSVLYND